MEPWDLEESHKMITKRKEETEAKIDQIMPFDHDGHSNHCWRDRSGEYHHDNHQCPINLDHDLTPECPFENWDNYYGQLEWIDTANFLTFYFRDPAAARGQRILHGLDNRSFFRYYRFVLSASYFGITREAMLMFLALFGSLKMLFDRRPGISASTVYT